MRKLSWKHRGWMFGVVLLVAPMCFAGRCAAGEERPAAHTSASLLGLLDCLEAWEQLCSPPPRSISIVVEKDRVLLDPFVDASFIFRIVEREAFPLSPLLPRYLLRRRQRTQARSREPSSHPRVRTVAIATGGPQTRVTKSSMLEEQ